MKNKLMALLILVIVFYGLVRFAETRGYENMGQCPQFTTCYCQQEYGNNYYWGHDDTMPLPHCIAKGK